MHSSLFFKLFPPPKFLLMPHTGIDISDDTISFIEYSRPIGGRKITKYGLVPLEPGIIENGDVRDEAKFIATLAEVAEKNKLFYARLSIPEEKAYLFEIEVPPGDTETISQNIEFKLEENIPLSAADTVFTFDLLPGDHNHPWRASVSAVPRTYIEHMISIFKKAGIVPIAFETIPRAVARAVYYKGLDDALIIHSMKTKTGAYIYSEGAIGFTSTIGAGSTESDISKYVDILADEVRRVYSYWLTRNNGENRSLKKVIVTGHNTELVTGMLRPKVSDIIQVEEIDVWRDILDTDNYVPPIDKIDSFDYTSAAGLAL